MIYLDNAAATATDSRVLKEMMPYLTEIYGNPSSQHSAGRAAAAALISARDVTAEIFGCRPSEVYFVSGGTEAGNWALKGACAASDRKRIVLSAIEHPALIESANDMKKHGYEVELIAPGGDGAVDPERVRAHLGDDVAFCAVMHANNETGVIQPVEKIGALCRERGIFYYCDCVQTAGVLPLPAAHCDALGISAHKFYGPKGVGAVYIRSGARIERFLSGGRQERGMRGGTVNVAGAVGLAAALKTAFGERERTNAYVSRLRDEFTDGVLSKIPRTALNGSRDCRLPSNANIAFSGCDGGNILMLLDRRGVCASVGSACSAGAVEPSHTLLAMGLGEERARSSVRFTFGKNNTEEEAKSAVKILEEIISSLRDK